MDRETPEIGATERQSFPADASHSITEKKGKKTASEKKELLARLENAEKQIKVLQDQLLRALAEMDNMRKRTEREKAQVIQGAARDLVLDLLPVVDDFERFLKSPLKKTTAKAFHDGMDLVYQKMMTAFRRHGLESMESKGNPFDVNFHDAVVRLRKEGIRSDVVVEDLQKGYFLNGKVVRHAKVAVSE